MLKVGINLDSKTFFVNLFDSDWLKTVPIKFNRHSELIVIFLYLQTFGINTFRFAIFSLKQPFPTRVFTH